MNEASFDVLLGNVLAASPVASVAIGCTLVAAAVAGWIWQQRATRAWRERAVAAERELALVEQHGEQRLTYEHQLRESLQLECDVARDETVQLRQQLAAQTVELTQERMERAANAQLRSSESERHDAELKRLEDQFRRLSEDTLKEQGSRQSAAIEQLLQPFREQLRALDAGMASQRSATDQARSALYTEVRNLRSASERVSQETLRLTTLLTGSHSVQGRWGEAILERLLEGSGLRRDIDYLVQPVQRSPAGLVQRPDVLLKLPAGQQVVIDAKVSLGDFQAAHEATAEAPSRTFLQKHARSLRQHARQLAERDYPALDPANTVPLVLMFVPLDAAVTAAIDATPVLFDEALADGVVIVTPQTMHVTLVLIRTLWRQQAQSENARAIAAAGHNIVQQIEQLVREALAAEQQAEKTLRAIRRLPIRLQNPDQGLLASARALAALGID